MIGHRAGGALRARERAGLKGTAWGLSMRTRSGGYDAAPDRGTAHKNEHLW